MEYFNYTINGNNYEVTIENVNDLTANVKVNGVTYQIKRNKADVKPFVSAHEASPTATDTPKVAEVTDGFVSSASASTMKSPLPGIILNITCKVGDKVKIGQQVLILEAMKMENSIAADKDGVVQKILVTKGMSVLEGEDLVVIG